MNYVVDLTITALMNAVILQDNAKNIIHQLLAIPVVSTRDVNRTIKDLIKNVKVTLHSKLGNVVISQESVRSSHHLLVI